MSRFRSALVCLATAIVMATAGGVPAQAAETSPASASSASDITAAASSGCGKAPTLTSGKYNIQSSGQNRSYILKVPANYGRNKPHKLIFGNHWLGGTAEQVAGGGSDGAVYAHYGLDALSNGSAVFVAPQGLNNGWANSNGQDVVFFDDMIRTVEAALCVDESQRFSLGFSYGGAMSYALACARPNVFRGVIAIAAPGGISGCSGGTGAVAYMGIHGVSDNIGAGRGMRDRFLSNNGCAAQNAPEPAAGSLTHTLTTYSCRAGFPVVWAPFDGGHQQGPVDGCRGCESGARSWVKGEMWRFISQFSSTPPVDSGQVRNSGAGRCLDVSAQSQSNGAVVQLWDCHDGANQQWNVNANGTITGVQSGLCLGTTNNGTANGTVAVLSACNGSTSQNWALS